jgi:hypothetical protein
MKHITSSLSGLSSSLFLAVGLTKFAEKLDPVASGRGQIVEMPDALSCSYCAACEFAARVQG